MTFHGCMYTSYCFYFKLYTNILKYIIYYYHTWLSAYLPMCLCVYLLFQMFFSFIIIIIYRLDVLRIVLRFLVARILCVVCIVLLLPAANVYIICTRIVPI